MATWGELENFTYGELSKFTYDELAKLSLDELTEIAKSTVNSPTAPQNLKDALRSIIYGIIASAAYDVGKSVDWHQVLLKFIEFLQSMSNQ